VSWTETRAALRVAWREYQLSYRGATFWGIAAAGSLLAIWRASPAGTSAAMAAYQTLQITLFGIAVLAILVGAAAAARDRREVASELVLAKPMGSTAHLVVARFAGVWLSLLTIVAIMLAAAMVRQAVGGTPWRLGAYGNAFARSLAPIALATAMGFSLTSLLVSPLAAGVAAVYWVCVPLARGYMPWVSDMTPAQHWPVPALLGAALVALAATSYGKALHTPGRGRVGLGGTTGLLFAAAALVILRFVLGGEDALVTRDPVLSAIAAQRSREGERAPGFWLPDGAGRLVGLSDFAGRPVVLAFWGPGSPESARATDILSEAARKYRGRGIACVAVCVDRDSATVGPFGREHPSLVMLWDRGQHYGDGERWSDSPLGLVYELKEVPTFFLLDRNGTVVNRVEGASAYALETALSDLMRAR